MNFKRVGLIVAGVLLAGLLFFNRTDVTLTKQDHFELNTISTAGYQLRSVVHLNNPNLLSSTVKSIHEDFYLNGVLVGTFANDINQGIPGRKETEFPIDIRFSQSSYQQGVQRDSLNRNIVVTGEVVFQNLMSGGKIKVHETGTFPVTHP